MCRWNLRVAQAADPVGRIAPMLCRYLALLAALLAVAASAGACGGSSKTTAGSPTPGPGTPTAITGDLTVFAASSLAEAFDDVAPAFGAAHPGARVRFNFAGSPTLRTQLEQGARSDALAVADQANMQAALDGGVVASAGRTFARNKLTIIVPKSNSAGVNSTADLASPGLKLVLAAKEVPAGSYAREAIAKMDAEPAYVSGFGAKVLANVVSEEPNVKAVVAKVQLGEADAGIVYATDVTAGVAGDVTAVDIPDLYNVIASYPIAATIDTARPELAQTFIDFLLSSEGQSILKRYGFLGAQ